MCERQLKRLAGFAADSKHVMAEFKFSCPQCGQRIQCDTGYVRRANQLSGLPAGHRRAAVAAFRRRAICAALVPAPRRCRPGLATQAKHHGSGDGTPFRRRARRPTGGQPKSKALTNNILVITASVVGVGRTRSRASSGSDSEIQGTQGGAGGEEGKSRGASDRADLFCHHSGVEHLGQGAFRLHQFSQRKGRRHCHLVLGLVESYLRRFESGFAGQSENPQPASAGHAPNNHEHDRSIQSSARRQTWFYFAAGSGRQKLIVRTSPTPSPCGQPTKARSCSTDSHTRGDASRHTASLPRPVR